PDGERGSRAGQASGRRRPLRLRSDHPAGRPEPRGGEGALLRRRLDPGLAGRVAKKTRSRHGHATSVLAQCLCGGRQAHDPADLRACRRVVRATGRGVPGDPWRRVRADRAAPDRERASGAAARGHAAASASWPPARSRAATRRSSSSLEGSVEEAEPAGEILLDRQLVLELRLQLELRRVVALLVAAGRDERPEGPALVAVDPVDRVLATVEPEGGGQELRSEATR